MPDYHWIIFGLLFGKGEVEEKESFYQMTRLIIIVAFPISSGLEILPQEMIKAVLWSIARLSSISDLL